ncbi:hypothetical protein AV530_018164 [Patagioenas fasciata monilis]|uniref:Uncharacterized protein n=1 Tax=Patagioenas fasciata monilis TaxID=372326 RepID=A0A1V4KL75_PATFA|nr:hypothetical protein AV530_018164 [Patagioenas fasciata monilis]
MGGPSLSHLQWPPYFKREIGESTLCLETAGNVQLYSAIGPTLKAVKWNQKKPNFVQDAIVTAAGSQSTRREWEPAGTFQWSLIKKEALGYLQAAGEETAQMKLQTTKRKTSDKLQVQQ